jgi:uncharacterized protein YjiS (DUF1127 family)
MTNSASILGQSQSRSIGPAAPRHPANDNLLQTALEHFQVWRERIRTRRHLSMMSDYQLKDIGISRADAYGEVQKPFWRG